MVLHGVSRSALIILTVVMLIMATRTTGPLLILGVTVLMVLALIATYLTNPKYGLARFKRQAH